MNDILTLLGRDGGNRRTRRRSELRSRGEGGGDGGENATKNKNFKHTHWFEVGQHPTCYVQRRQSTEPGLAGVAKGRQNPLTGDILSQGSLRIWVQAN